MSFLVAAAIGYGVLFVFNEGAESMEPVCKKSLTPRNPPTWDQNLTPAQKCAAMELGSAQMAATS